MRYGVRLLWAGLVLVAPAARAQGRAIPLPDTLGANFPLADSATKAGTPADYDALLGSWLFRFQFRRPDGVFEQPFPGH